MHEMLTGMSDLCSPMIMLLEDEADAFWCFERLMRRLVPSLIFLCFSQFCPQDTLLCDVALG
jgi:hypothetical protein